MIQLTPSDCILLQSIGHSNTDIAEIRHGIKKTTYFILDEKSNKSQITEDEALTILGREEWLRGIARSSFYMETTRYGLAGERVRMETKLFS